MKSIQIYISETVFAFLADVCRASCIIILPLTIVFITTLQIDGTIVAPDEPKNWNPNLARLWLDFTKLNGVLFQGNGVIDGSGSKWWASSCKKNKTNVIIQKF